MSTLPPAQQAQLEYASQTSHYVTIAFVSIYLFDFVATIPKEFQLYYNRGWSAFKSSIVWLFIIIRYAALSNAITDIYVNASSHGAKSFNTCVALVRAPLAMLLLTNYATNCLFTLRAYALSNRNRFVAIFLLILAAFQIPPAISYQLGIHAGPNAAAGCVFKVSDQYSISIFYGMGLLFDLTAFGITAWYLMNGFQRLGFWTPVAKALFEDGAIYLMVATSVQLANLLGYHVIPKMTFLRGITGPLVFLTAVMGQRVALNHLTDFSIRGVVRSRFNASTEAGSAPQSRQGLRSYKSSGYGDRSGTYGQNTQQTQVSLSSPPPTSYSHGYAGSQQSREKYEYEMA